MNCINCGDSLDFPERLLKTRKFCSWKCYVEKTSREHWIERKCPTCTTLFLTRLSKPRTHCSETCAYKDRPNKKIVRVCLNCEQQFRSKPSGNKKFCSINCYSNYRHKKRSNLCVQCGNFFQPLNRHQRFCSRLCKGLSQKGRKQPKDAVLKRSNTIRQKAVSLSEDERKRRWSHPPVLSDEAKGKISESKIGPKNPMWKPPIVKVCQLCDKKFKVKPYKEKRMFCSLKCSRSAHKQRMKKENPMKNTEISSKVFSILRQKYKQPEFKMAILKSRSRHPNGFEKKFIDFVEENGLPFEFVGNFSFWIGPCKSGKCRNPDFIHKDHSIKRAILIGAEYHHPKLKLNEELEDYGDYGWEVLHIWQKDFETQKEMVLKGLMEFNNGEKNGLEKN